MFGSMPPCHSANWPFLVRRVDGPAHAVLVVPHVAVGHRDRVDVRVDERRIPRQRVRHAVDVVPAAGVEADEARPERGADLRQLEHRLELLDEHVGLDGADRQAEMRFEPAHDVVPQRASSAVWIFGRYSTSDEPFGAQPRLVVHDEGGQIDDRGREAAAVGAPDVAIVEVQPAGPEDLGGEPELLLPVADNRPAEERLRPGVHLGGHASVALRNTSSLWIASFRLRWLSSAIVESWPERVLAVEHPAVGAGQQRVGDVADALVHRRRGLGAGAGALDPLPLQVGRNRAAVNAPARASATVIFVRAMMLAGSRNAIRSPFLARGARRSRRAVITACRSSSSGASSRRAVTTSEVRTSG
jgi:hypothetical protein